MGSGSRTSTTGLHSYKNRLIGLVQTSLSLITCALYAPELEVAIIGGMNSIAAEGNCIGGLGGMFVDRDLDASPAEFRNHDFEEVGHRPRFQGQLALPPLAAHNFRNMPVEVEHDLESAIFVIDGRLRKAARVYIERNVQE